MIENSKIFKKVQLSQNLSKLPKCRKTKTVVFIVEVFGLLFKNGGKKHFQVLEPEKRSIEILNVSIFKTANRSTKVTVSTKIAIQRRQKERKVQITF